MGFLVPYHVLSDDVVTLTMVIDMRWISKLRREHDNTKILGTSHFQVRS